MNVSSALCRKKLFDISTAAHARKTSAWSVLKPIQVIMRINTANLLAKKGTASSLNLIRKNKRASCATSAIKASKINSSSFAKRAMKLSVMSVRTIGE